MGRSTEQPMLVPLITPRLSVAVSLVISSTPHPACPTQHTAGPQRQARRRRAAPPQKLSRPPPHCVASGAAAGCYTPPPPGAHTADTTHHLWNLRCSEKNAPWGHRHLRNCLLGRPTPARAFAGAYASASCTCMHASTSASGPSSTASADGHKTCLAGTLFGPTACVCLCTCVSACLSTRLRKKGVPPCDAM